MPDPHVLIVDQMGVLQSERRKYEALAETGELSVTVLVPDKWRFNFQLTNCEAKNSELYDLIPLPVTSPGFGHRSFFRGTLGRLFREIRPDVIHIFQEPYSLFAAQVALARNLFCRRAKLIFITWQNIYFDKYHYKGAALHHAVERFVYRNAACATPITFSSNEVLKQRGFNKPTHVLNWGIDPERFRKQDVPELRAKLNLKDKFVVGYVGRFVEEKGLSDLVTAVSHLPEHVQLLLIGDGPQKTEIKNIAESCGMNTRLTIVPSVSNSEMAPYINCMDVLVLPSCDSKYWKEQLGKVLLEAMACEVPVVGTDSGEIPHVIGDNGFVFPQGDVEELTKQLAFISSGRDDLADKVSAAKQRVHQIYNWQAIAGNLNRLYRELYSV